MRWIRCHDPADSAPVNVLSPVEELYTQTPGLHFGCFPSQERELMGRIGELQDEVSRRKNHVTQLDHQIHALNENISTLTKELELKGKEVLKIRGEASQQIRWDAARRRSGR